MSPTGSPDDLERLKREAEAAKLAAEAASSRAAAATAEAAAEKAKQEAAKAAADARAASAAADKAQLEATQQSSTVAQQQRDAAARQAIAEADKAAAAARREQLTALIPDLSKVEKSTVEVKEGPLLFASVATARSLKGAAHVVGDALEPALLHEDVTRVLVTSDPDLASTDAVYQDVDSGLDQLGAMAKRLLDAITVGREGTEFGAEFVPPDVIAALAGAVPDVLSLLAAHRTVSSAATTADDLAAQAVVMHEIRERKHHLALLHDDFRVVPRGVVYQKVSDLSSTRQQLVGRKLNLSDNKNAVDTQLEELENEAGRLEKRLDEAPNDEKLAGELKHVQQEVAAKKAESASLGVRIGLIDSTTSAIDTFVSAIRVVPEGARRSALATAALHELLHIAGDDSRSLPRPAGQAASGASSTAHRQPAAVVERPVHHRSGCQHRVHAHRHRQLEHRRCRPYDPAYQRGGKHRKHVRDPRSARRTCPLSFLEHNAPRQSAYGPARSRRTPTLRPAKRLRLAEPVGVEAPAGALGLVEAGAQPARAVGKRPPHPPSPNTPAAHPAGPPFVHAAHPQHPPAYPAGPDPA